MRQKAIKQGRLQHATTTLLETAVQETRANLPYKFLQTWAQWARGRDFLLRHRPCWSAAGCRKPCKTRPAAMLSWTCFPSHNSHGFSRAKLRNSSTGVISATVSAAQIFASFFANFTWLLASAIASLQPALLGWMAPQILRARPLLDPAQTCQGQANTVDWDCVRIKLLQLSQPKCHVFGTHRFISWHPAARDCLPHELGGEHTFSIYNPLGYSAVDRKEAQGWMEQHPARHSLPSHTGGTRAERFDGRNAKALHEQAVGFSFLPFSFLGEFAMPTLGVVVRSHGNELAADVEACVLKGFGCQNPIALACESFGIYQVPCPPADLQTVHDCHQGCNVRLRRAAAPRIPCHKASQKASIIHQASHHAFQSFLKLASSSFLYDFAAVVLQPGHMDDTDVIHSFDDEWGFKCWRQPSHKRKIQAAQESIGRGQSRCWLWDDHELLKPLFLNIGAVGTHLILGHDDVFRILRQILRLDLDLRQGCRYCWELWC